MPCHLLPGLPSGSKVYSFGNPSAQHREGVVVQFEDDSKYDWIGNFLPSDPNFSSDSLYGSVYTFPDSGICTIFVGSEIFIVDPTQSPAAAIEYFSGATGWPTKLPFEMNHQNFLACAALGGWVAILNHTGQIILKELISAGDICEKGCDLEFVDSTKTLKASYYSENLHKRLNFDLRF